MASVIGVVALFFGPVIFLLNAFLISTAVVALAETGDKTQLLALLLATRYRRPFPIVLGIFVATLLNHAGAGALGGEIAQRIGADTLRWVLGMSFVLTAAWMLVQDQLDHQREQDSVKTAWGVFWVTLVAFFVAEMGDKTQIATIALAARFEQISAVVAGSVLGMMLANVPVVVLGERFARRLPVRLLQRAAAGILLTLGLLAIFGVGR